MLTSAATTSHDASRPRPAGSRSPASGSWSWASSSRERAPSSTSCSAGISVLSTTTWPQPCRRWCSGRTSRRPRRSGARPRASTSSPRRSIPTTSRRSCPRRATPPTGWRWCASSWAAPRRSCRAGSCWSTRPASAGLESAHGAITIAALTDADAVVFVTDASQEMTAPELAFLRHAHELCPTVLHVVSKIDLYPEWRRILEISTGHLRRAGLEGPVLGISSTVHRVARSGNDRSLLRESGFADFTRDPPAGRHRTRRAGRRRRGAARRAIDARSAARSP